MAKCINVKYDGKPLYDIVVKKSLLTDSLMNLTS